MTDLRGSGEADQPATGAPNALGDAQPDAGEGPTEAAKAEAATTPLKQELSHAPKQSFRPRFGMLSLMLFAGVVCVWSMYFQLLRVNPQIQLQIESMRALSTELVLSDLERISVAKQLNGWYDEAIWQVYIPAGQTFQMCLATREISPNFGTAPNSPPVAAQMSLQPGTYKIELKQEKVNEGQRVVVLVNDEDRLTVVETDEAWYPGHGSSGGAQFATPSQPSNDKTIVLYRRRFMHDKGGGNLKTPDGPVNGVELRLEKQQ